MSASIKNNNLSIAAVKTKQYFEGQALPQFDTAAFLQHVFFLRFRDQYDAPARMREQGAPPTHADGSCQESTITVVGAHVGHAYSMRVIGSVLC
jgi:hypothetical protein